MTTEAWERVSYADWLERQHEGLTKMHALSVGVTTAYPYATLHELLLGRLDGQSVGFELKGTPYGDLRFEPAVFSLVYLAHASRSFVYERTTLAVNGVRVRMLFDVLKGVVTLDAADSDELYLLTVNQWLLGRPRRIGARSVTVDVMLDITDGVSTPSPVLIQLDRIETYVLEALRQGTLSVNRVARLTHIPASTFSRLKNEKQSFRNLPLATLLPMGVLADILAFDAAVAAAWTSERPVRSGQVRIVVETTDVTYTIDGENEALVDSLHARLLADLSAAHVTLTGFVDGVSDGETRYPQVTLRTADIRRIYRTGADSAHLHLTTNQKEPVDAQEPDWHSEEDV